MSVNREIKAVRCLRGELSIPGDKSISHRSVMLSSLGDTSVRITNFLNSADCLSTVHCMRSLGVKIEQIHSNEIIVHGGGFHGLRESAAVLDAGNSGTTLRLLLGLLASQRLFSVFSGDDSLSNRPMGRVITPLRKMGATLMARGDSRFLPIAVLPVKDKLKGISYDMPMASGQVKSALLLAGLYADGPTTVTEPYVSRDHTEKMLETFGVSVERSGMSVTVTPPERLTAPEQLAVPGDISSAAFWLVAATIIPDSELLLRNVGVNPTRSGVIDVLRQMGANIQFVNERFSGREPVADLLVKSAQLHGIEIGGGMIPRLIDEIPALAVAAMLADSRTTITGASELRVKETDRLRAIAEEFNKFGGGCIEELTDGLIINPSRGFSYAECDSYHDHRIAMSLAIAGAAGKGIFIKNSECINISYPEFYANLEILKA